MNTTLSICVMAGPALGGAIVALGGTRVALLVNVGVFASVTVMLATATGLPTARPEHVPAIGRLRSALVQVRQKPLVRRLLGLEAAGILFFTISVPVEVVFAQRTLHVGAGGYGVLLAGWGAGLILGSGVYARWRAVPSRVMMTLGTCLLGFGFLVMAVAPSLAVATAGAIVGGVGNGVEAVAIRTALQEATPEEWMALMLSVNESIFLAVPGAGFVLGGLITQLAGTRTAFAVGATGSLLVGLMMWARLAGTQDSTRTDMLPPADIAGSESAP